MEFIKSLWEKDITRKLFAFTLIMIIVYLLRNVIDIFLLTFLFTYLIYNIQEFIINSLKPFIKINQLLITIMVYSVIFILLGYFIYKFVPIIISESISIINGFNDVKFKSDINEIEEYLYPLIGNIDIEGCIKKEANSIFEFIADIGKCAINLLLSVILSLFFMLEKSRVEGFLKKFENSRISRISKYLKMFGINLLNSFGKVVQVQILIAATNTVLSITALSIMGFPQLIALAFMIFMFSLIPVAGSIVSLVPLSIIAYNIGGFPKVMYVISVIALLYLFETYVLNPQFMSVKTHIPVFIVFLILIISEHLIGIWGILVGIPLFIFILDLLDVNINKS